MTRPGDPKGYYARLGIAAWATPQAIEFAFKSRARALDADPVQSLDPTRRQALAEAHQVLADPVLRRAYDDESGIDDDESVYAPPARPMPALPWYRRKEMVGAFLGSAMIAVVAVAVWRAPPTVVSAPARALTPPPMPASVPRYERRLVTGSGVNLRAGPGTEHQLTGRVARGEMVDLLQPEEEGWAYIRLGDGRRGYIAARFLAYP